MSMKSAKRDRPSAPQPNRPGTMSNTAPFNPAPKKSVDVQSASDCDGYLDGELEEGTGKG